MRAPLPDPTPEDIVELLAQAGPTIISGAALARAEGTTGTAATAAGASEAPAAMSLVGSGPGELISPQTARQHYAGLPTEPAVPIEKSRQPDGVICLFDGVKRANLKRYLVAKYGMSPALIGGTGTCRTTIRSPTTPTWNVRARSR